MKSPPSLHVDLGDDLETRHQRIELHELSDEDVSIDAYSTLFHRHPDLDHALDDASSNHAGSSRSSSIDLYTSMVKHLFRTEYVSYVFRLCVRSTKQTLFRSPGCISLAFFVMFVLSFIYTTVFAFTPMIVARSHYFPCSCFILSNVTVTSFNSQYFRTERIVNVHSCLSYDGLNVSSNVPSQFLSNSTLRRESPAFISLPPNDFSHISMKSALSDNVKYRINETYPCWASPSSSTQFSVLLDNPFSITPGQWVCIGSIIVFGICAIAPPLAIIFHVTATSFNNFLLEMRRLAKNASSSSSNPTTFKPTHNGFTITYKGEPIQSGYEIGDYSHLAFFRSSTT